MDDKNKLIFFIWTLIIGIQFLNLSELNMTEKIQGAKVV